MKNHEIIKNLLMFINDAKEADNELAFVDIILEFSEVYNVDEQLVHEAIQDDVYFKKLIYDDCVAHGIIKTDKETLKEW